MINHDPGEPGVLPTVSRVALPAPPAVRRVTNGK